MAQTLGSLGDHSSVELGITAQHAADRAPGGSDDLEQTLTGLDLALGHIFR